MDYIFIFGLQLFGILFHVGQTIIKLDQDYKEKSIREIFNLFFDNEWASLGVSAIIMTFDLFVHSIIDYYDMPITGSSFTIPGTQITVGYLAISFMLALVFGYGGQRLAYKYLGKASDYLSKKAD